MSPRAQRHIPVHRQVAEDIAARISAGEEGYRPGDKLPSIRKTADDWDVAFSAAQEAYRLLVASKQAETRDREGTYVLPPRNVFGPYQEMRSSVAAVAAEAQQVTVTAADLVPVPEYIRPILHLSEAVSHVIRREWTTGDSTGVYMLSVSWVPARYANVAPELLERVPLADPAGPAHLVSERAHQPVTWSTNAHETRQIMDDGREGPLLGLKLGDYISADTFVWGHRELALEYREFITKPNRVIVTNLEL